MIGSTLKHFQIIDELGKGGMGEVWRAHDSKLDREVAVKLLPEAMSEDPERLARFEREAKMLASLNHPNIAAIFGIEEAEGRQLLILELVEGEELGEHIGRGAMPVDEALDVAHQIAEALEAAHQEGIVHRDLKPANVKLTPGGRVKVLDFGLAKAFEPTADQLDLTRSPTLTAHMTAAGVVLGTAAYMSPEQARGIEVDKRADIWAFGCVLYEMLTGKQSFRGDTVSDVMASILKEEPDLDALPAGTPRRLRRLLERCLNKDPHQRLHDIADARIEIEEIQAGGEAAEPETRIEVRQGRFLRIWQLLAAALLLLALGLGWMAMGRESAPREVFRAFIPAPEETVFALDASSPGTVAVSPDGNQMAFSAIDDVGDTLLWIRRMGDLTARPIPGTDGAAYPFWSPDSRHVAFFSGDGKLRKIDTAGGPPVTLCPAENGKGGWWGEDGQVLFTPAHNTPIFVVSSAGGEPRQVTEIPDGVVGHRFPVWLPNGNFLFLSRSTSGDEGDRIMVSSIDETGPGREVLAASSNVAVASGYILFVREGTLMAQPFDEDSVTLSGEAIPVAEDVLYLTGARRGVFSVSKTGLLSYQTGAVARESDLVWVDREGRELGQLGGGVLHREVRLSPDGRFAAVEILDDTSGASDIWIYDVNRGLKTRFTFDPGMDWFPSWSPDGKRLAFSTERNGSYDIWINDVGGSTSEEALLEHPDDGMGPESWSPDGQWLVFLRVVGGSNQDIWAMPVDGGEPVPLVATSFREVNPSVSPDGRWLAFMSDESGQFEVYVTTFPEPGRRWQVSSAGGSTPRWRGDGRELFFRTGDGMLWAAAVDGTSDTLTVGTVEELFSWVRPPGIRPPYDVSSDGQRFLINRAVNENQAEPLAVVLNWDSELAADSR